jgi:hypothetical protein
LGNPKERCHLQELCPGVKKILLKEIFKDYERSGDWIELPYDGER